MNSSKQTKLVEELLFLRRRVAELEQTLATTTPQTNQVSVNQTTTANTKKQSLSLKQIKRKLQQEIKKRKQIEASSQKRELKYRQQAAELQALHNISLRLNRQLETTELLNLIAEQVILLLEAEVGALYTYEAQQNALRLEVTVGHFKGKVGTMFDLHNYTLGQAVAGKSSTAYLINPKLSSIYQGMSYLDSVLVVPLIGHWGMLGILVIGSKQKAYTDEHDQWLVELFAAQAVVALENAYLHTQTQTHAQQLTALNKASQAVTSTLELPSVLDQIIEVIYQLLIAEDVSVLLYDEKIDALQFATTASGAFDILSNVYLSINEGIAGWVFRKKQAVLVNDNIKDDPRFHAKIDHLTGMTTHSLIAVPLIIKDKAIGVIEVINKINGLFDDNDLRILNYLASSAAIAIENAQLYKREREHLDYLEKSQTKIVQTEKMAALGRLVGSIAHEINNPLQSLQGFMALLTEELNGRYRQDKILRYIDITTDEIKRIAMIVQRMRDFYQQPEFVEPELCSADSIDDFYRPKVTELERVYLPNVINEALQLTDKKLTKQNITIKQDWSQDLPLIEGIADQLKQIFINLILNAIDAMPHGGYIHVIISLEHLMWGDNHAPEPILHIDFYDTGMGMDDEVLERVFEPLFTTKNHGSGFGLFTSYKIIEAHQGQITVDSQVGIGTSFTILLPLEQQK